MINDVCKELNNWFTTKEDQAFGRFKVENGALVPDPEMQPGQYYRIIGSVFNDGVHRQGDELQSEAEFSGAIWKMRIPKEVVDLTEEIARFEEKAGEPSAYVSESFAGYSYTKATKDGAPAGWQDVFRSKLNKWRKI